jgi:hypothetical protein
MGFVVLVAYVFVCYNLTFVFWVFVGLVLPGVSWSPKLCKSGAIVLARVPDFGGQQILGRFVVLVEGVFVYDVLT